LSLAQRLFLLVAVALLPAILLQAYNEVERRDARQAEIRDLALRQAEQAASEIGQIVEGVRNVLLTVAEEPAVRALDTPACVAFLATLLPRLPQLASIVALDFDGKARCRQDTPPADLRFADRAYFRDAIASADFVVGEYTESRISGRQVLPLALPLRDGAGRTIGVLAASLDLRWLTDHLRERSVPMGGSITVADQNGVIIAREPLPERFIGTRIPDAFLPLVNAPAPGALEVTSQDGTRRMLGYVPAARSPAGIYVSAGLSTEQAFAEVNRATRWGVGLIVAGLALAFGMAWFVGQRFVTRPIGLLLAAAARWRAGEYAARTGLAGWGAELGALGAAFDGMAEEIGRRQGEQERTTAALRESEAKLRATQEHAGVGIAEVDAEGRMLRVNEALCTITGYARDELRGRNVFDITHPDDSPTERGDYARLVRGEAESYTREKRYVRRDGNERWVEVAASAVRDTDGRFLYGVRIVQDVTDRRQAGARRAVLLAELNHRVKNTLAVVRGIAARSLSGERTLAEGRGLFNARLLALSRAHDLLTASQWRGAGLRAVLRGELAPYGARAILSGPELALSPKAALTLALVVHELATNALKYGALASPDGRVDVAWSLEEAELRLRWRERDGPPVEVPLRRGFGRVLLEQGVKHDLGGEVTLDFRPDGLVYEIAVPAEAAVGDGMAAEEWAAPAVAGAGLEGAELVLQANP
jgi:PAS domain S-box-containing protein